MQTAKVLIVEDEVELAEIFRDYLIASGFLVDVTHSGAGVAERVRDDPPDLMLLDLMLPEVDGITICKAIRETSNLPIVMVTAKVSEVDRLLGLEVGADDYICKPANPREVVARVKAVLRRASLTASRSGLECLGFDEEAQLASLEGEYFDLTPLEFKLLDVLNRNAHHICPRDALKAAISDGKNTVSDAVLDAHVMSLSEKLRTASGIMTPVRSVYALGFVLELDSKASDAYPGSVQGLGSG